jgi:hypothetical protein
VTSEDDAAPFGLVLRSWTSSMTFINHCVQCIPRHIYLTRPEHETTLRASISFVSTLCVQQQHLHLDPSRPRPAQHSHQAAIERPSSSARGRTSSAALAQTPCNPTGERNTWVCIGRDGRRCTTIPSPSRAARLLASKPTHHKIIHDDEIQDIPRRTAYQLSSPMPK